MLSWAAAGFWYQKWSWAVWGNVGALIFHIALIPIQSANPPKTKPKTLKVWTALLAVGAVLALVFRQWLLTVAFLFGALVSWDEIVRADRKHNRPEGRE